MRCVNPLPSDKRKYIHDFQNGKMTKEKSRRTACTQAWKRTKYYQVARVASRIELSQKRLHGKFCNICTILIGFFTLPLSPWSSEYLPYHRVVDNGRLRELPTLIPELGAVGHPPIGLQRFPFSVTLASGQTMLRTQNSVPSCTHDVPPLRTLTNRTPVLVIGPITRYFPTI